MKKTYTPTILASDGREYTNVAYNTLADAEKALYEFCEIFRLYHDEEIKKAYIQCGIILYSCIYPFRTPCKQK